MEATNEDAVIAYLRALDTWVGERVQLETVAAELKPARARSCHAALQSLELALRAMLNASHVSMVPALRAKTPSQQMAAVILPPPLDSTEPPPPTLPERQDEDVERDTPHTGEERVRIEKHQLSGYATGKPPPMHACPVEGCTAMTNTSICGGCAFDFEAVGTPLPGADASPSDVRAWADRHDVKLKPSA